MLRAHFQGNVTTDLDRQLSDLARLLDLVHEVNNEDVGTADLIDTDSGGR